MDAKPAITSTRAGKLPPKLLVSADAAEAKQAKVGRFLQGMAMFEVEQGKHSPSWRGVLLDSLPSLEAKTHGSTAALYPNPSATGQSPRLYRLPLGLQQISSSLKIDDPLTPMRIGQLSNFIEKVDPVTGTKSWLGITWAEIFFPVLGERPRSVVGSKAYEVFLKQPIKDGGKIVRENVLTTGRVIGVVVADLPHETVSVRIEDWFSNSEVFKKGQWNQLDVAPQTIQAGASSVGTQH